MKELSERIRERIIYNADETKYRYEIGKKVMDRLIKEILEEVDRKED